MALSDALKQKYSSNPINVRVYDTLELSHSLFTSTIYLVMDSEDHSFNLNTGDPSPVLFTSYPFEIQFPEAGENQQDMKIVLDNVSRIPGDELEKASANVQEPIIATYRPYISGSLDPQSLPIRLVLTNITADARTVSAIATRPDLFKRKFPTGKEAFFDDRFIGIAR